MSDLLPPHPPTPPPPLALPEPQSVGEQANRAASAHVFEEYRLRKSQQTLRRQDADLAMFGEFLAKLGLLPRTAQRPHPLASDPQAWQGVTWGLLLGFQKWLAQAGYAVATINSRLNGVRVYAGLAAQAGALPLEEWARMQGVHGFAGKEARRLDAARTAQGQPTRRQTRYFGSDRAGAPLPTHKKNAPVRISREQAQQLVQSAEDSATGRRDNLLMELLLSLGLRVGEVVLLRVEQVDFSAGEMRLYRPKVDLEQTHRLSANSLRLMRLMLDAGDILPNGALLRRIEKDGKAGQRTLSIRGAAQRVAELGRALGLEGLSPHDCRHYWASLAAESATDPFALQEAGGWASLEMPRRYVERQRVANANLRLGGRKREFPADFDLPGALEGEEG